MFVAQERLRIPTEAFAIVQSHLEPVGSFEGLHKRHIGTWTSGMIPLTFQRPTNEPSLCPIVGLFIKVDAEIFFFGDRCRHDLSSKENTDEK